MEESSFVPGVNWHGTRVVDCLGPDKVIYASKSNIVILTWTSDGYLPRIIYYTHDDRVNAVAAAPSNASDALRETFVSCGNDGNVRLWSTETMGIVKAHKSHVSRDSAKTPPAVTGLSWSRVNPNLVVSVGANGCLVTWHVTENVTSKFSVRKAHFCAVACSTVDEGIVAAASGGAISILRLLPSSIKVSSLRVFQGDISCLAWQPQGENPVLAVTSQRGELSFWDIKAERCIKSMKLEPQRGHKENNASCTMYPLLWADENTVLSRSGRDLIAADRRTLLDVSDQNGEPNWREKGKQWRVVHSTHRRDFFALASPSQGGLVWTAGSDRSIVGYDVIGGKEVRKVGTLFGAVICSSVSPHDSNLVAFGGADGCVRIWNVTQPTGTTNSEQRNVQDKVMSVCWHPEKENTLLYGTSTGRIGVMEATCSKAPYLLVSPAAKPVYWLCWGPSFFPNPEKGQNKVLYAVANRTIYMYDDVHGTTRDSPRDIGSELSLPSSVTDMAWKPDFSLLAVGCKNGSISLLLPSSSVPVHTLSVQDAVQYLTWHPQMTSTDTEISPYHNLLTCGSVDHGGIISVFKVEQLENSVSSSVVATLKGHHDYVQSVAWSPHVSGHLVSSSADCSIQIWNVLTETPLINYQPNPGAISWFAIWSPVHSDFIISGSIDSTIRVWKTSNKLDKLPSITSKKPKKKGKTVHPCDMAEEKDYGEGQEKGKSSAKVDPTSLKKQTPKTQTAQLAKSANLNKATPSLITNAWSRSGAEFDVCYSLLSASNKVSNSAYTLCFLSTDENVREKLKQQEEYHSAAGQIDALTASMMWQGRLKELLEKKIEEGGLTDTLVALAPSVSPRLWQLSCCAYARELRVQHRHSDAANYLLAARKIEEAVQVLCEGKLYQEALCLARAQLPKDDPAFKDIVREYGKELAVQGKHGRAAECFIYLEQFDDAAQTLSQSQDPLGLCAAALAASKAGNPHLEHEMALTAFCLSVHHNKKDVADIFQHFFHIECLKLLCEVYAAIQTPEGEDSKPLLEAVLKKVTLKDKCQCYSQIISFRPKQFTTATSQPTQAWVVVQELALACCAPQDTTRSRHILRALEAAHIQGSAELCKICQMLSPGLTIDGYFSSNGELGTSLRAFLCLALLHRADFNSDEARSLLPRIASLQHDLLDDKSFSYHRAKSELPGWQKKLSEMSVAVKSNKAAENGTNSDDDQLVNGLSEVKISSEESKPSVASIVDERNRLVLYISKIEKDRIVVPNPVMGFLLMRNICEGLSGSDETAKELLKNISEKCLPLIR